MSCRWEWKCRTPVFRLGGPIQSRTLRYRSDHLQWRIPLPYNCSFHYQSHYKSDRFVPTKCDHFSSHFSCHFSSSFRAMFRDHFSSHFSITFRHHFVQCFVQCFVITIRDTKLVCARYVSQRYLVNIKLVRYEISFAPNISLLIAKNWI